MNSEQRSLRYKSEGINFRPLGVSFLSLFLVFFLSACTVVHKREHDQKNAEATIAIGEVSLKGDRAEVEKLRKDIPLEVRKENDELKELLSLMGEVREPPSRVRDKFNRILRKKSDLHKRETRKARDNFNRDEKKARKAILEKFKEEREDFKSQKATQEITRGFYADQDRRRRDFFAEQRDKRKDFETDMRQKSSDFNAYLRDRRREFNEEYRNYSKKYQELKKKKREEERARRSASQSRLSSPLQTHPSKGQLEELKDFEKMNSVPSEKLSTEDK